MTNQIPERLITDKQIVSMCDKLSYKYNSQTHREDMLQEGVLVCYEILAEEPDAHPAKLYREAKRRMHDYLNLDTQPVTIPAHNISRRLVRDITDSEIGNMGQDSVDWLKLVLSAEDRPYDEDYSVCDKDHAAHFETKEYETYVRSVVTETLSPTELCVVKLRYYEDMTQDAVAVAMGATQPWVSRHENAALGKLREKLL